MRTRGARRRIILLRPHFHSAPLLLIIFLSMIGQCGGGSSRRSSYDSSSAPSYTATPSSAANVPAPEPAVSLYAHGTLNVRTGPGKDYPVLRELSRGDLVRVGEKDGRGWARVESSYGASAGYVYRASDLLLPSPPVARAPGGEAVWFTTRSARAERRRGAVTGPCPTAPTAVVHARITEAWPSGSDPRRSG
jgi:hypothetical protein